MCNEQGVVGDRKTTYRNKTAGRNAADAVNLDAHIKAAIRGQPPPRGEFVVGQHATTKYTDRTMMIYTRSSDIQSQTYRLMFSLSILEDML